MARGAPAATPCPPAAPPAAGRRSATGPPPLAHHRPGPARRWLRDGADRHRLAVGQRLETGTPGNGRARRPSGPATIALHPRSWRTEIDLTCCYQSGAAEPPSDRYEPVAHC